MATFVVFLLVVTVGAALRLVQMAAEGPATTEVHTYATGGFR
jgi:hypothetical protein